MHPCRQKGYKVTRYQRLRFGKVETWAFSRQIYSIKSALNRKCQTFFKSQTLTPGNFGALCPSRIHSTSFDRSIFFLKDKILKKCIAAVLRGFLLAQSYPILLHKMAFQPFLQPVSVHILRSKTNLTGKVLPYQWCN